MSSTTPSAADAAFATLRERFPDKTDDEIRAAIAAASKAKTKPKPKAAEDGGKPKTPKKTKAIDGEAAAASGDTASSPDAAAPKKRQS